MKNYYQQIKANKGHNARRIKHSKPLSSYEAKINKLKGFLKKYEVFSMQGLYSRIVFSKKGTKKRVKQIKAYQSIRLKALLSAGFKTSQFKAIV